MRNDPDQHPDDPSNYPEEPMSAWDDPAPLDSDVEILGPGAGETLLRAIWGLCHAVARHERTDEMEVVDAYTQLRNAMDDIDWSAMDFAQRAVQEGQRLYSCFDTNDVLIRYEPRRKRDPAQPSLDL